MIESQTRNDTYQLGLIQNKFQFSCVSDILNNTQKPNLKKIFFHTHLHYIHCFKVKFKSFQAIVHSSELIQKNYFKKKLA